MFYPGLWWELDLWAHAVYVRLWEGVTNNREIQMKSKMSIILSNKHQDPVRRNCFPSTKNMNLIPTQQERSDKRKTSCKHPNHMANFKQELKTSSARKPRMTLPENQAEFPELLQGKAHRGVWVKKHPQPKWWSVVLKNNMEGVRART